MLLGLQEEVVLPWLVVVGCSVRPVVLVLAYLQEELEEQEVVGLVAVALLLLLPVVLVVLLLLG